MSTDELKRYAILDELTAISLMLDEAQSRIEKLIGVLNVLRELERGCENEND